MKKQWQQKAQALSRADMKKIKGGNGPITFSCSNSGPCTINGLAGTCRSDFFIIDNDDDDLFGLFNCNCVATRSVANGTQMVFGPVPECRIISN